MRFQKDDIVIFADDLTGALDAAVQFSKQNIPTIAFPTAEAFLENRDWSYCVYVVNTTTRHVARQEAYETVRALAAAVRQAGWKPDSPDRWPQWCSLGNAFCWRRKMSENPIGSVPCGGWWRRCRTVWESEIYFSLKE
mgnify:CR=1 FL=1